MTLFTLMLYYEKLTSLFYFKEKVIYNSQFLKLQDSYTKLFSKYKRNSASLMML